MTDDVCGYPTANDTPCQHPTTDDGDSDRCWVDGHNESDTTTDDPGRPSKFDEHREAVLEAAEEPIKTLDVARTAGVGKSTLYDWLDEYEEFSDAFRRARSRAARTLVQRGLEDPDVDTRMVTFLLERTFDYIQKQEVEHTGDGLDVTLSTEEKEALNAAFDRDPQ